MNHPHKSQASAMDRAGELTDGEQLRECINSGQVSAAQVVAHAEAGELRLQGSPFESKMAMALHAAFFDGWGACRDAEFIGDEAANDAFNQSATLGLCLSIDQNPVINHAAALAAKQEEVARLREALEGAYALAIGHATTYQLNHQLAEVHPTHQAILDKARAALTAPGEKHD